MKEIISMSSSGTGTEMNGQNSPEYLSTLQILMRIEKVLGSQLPGNQFEAAELTCGFSERRKLRKKAKQTNTWVRFLKEGKDGYLLLTPSIKIVDDETKPLTQQEMLSCLAEVEIISEKRENSIGSKLKRGISWFKNKLKETAVLLKNRLRNFITGGGWAI